MKSLAILLLVLTSLFATADDKFKQSQFVPYVDYPQIARAARVEGTVVVKVVLKDGYVTACGVESGHPMLGAAAVSSLKNAQIDSGLDGTFQLKFHFVLLGRDTEEDWKKPEKIEWLLPDITIVRRQIEVQTSR